MGGSGKNHVEIRGSELNQAIQCMQTIENAMKTALAKGEALKADIDGNGGWSGRNKQAISAYLDILLQYQRQMTKTASAHATSLKSLQRAITSFSGTEEVAKIRGL